MRRLSPGIALVFALALLVAAVAPLPAALAGSAQDSDLVKHFWFRTRIRQENLSWFNENARATDIASVDSRSLGLLDQIGVGRKQALFASAAEAEQIVPSLADKITDLCYDPEHWAQTPAAEQADLVSAVKRMRDLADKYDLTLMVGPDRRFTEQYGAAIAPYVDIYLLQVQRLQTDPEALLSYLTPLVRQIRAANPEIRIVAQLRTEGTGADVLALIGTLAPYLDGVSLLMNAQTLPVAGEIVRGIGQGVAVSEASATAAAQLGPFGTPDPRGPNSPAPSLSGTLPLTESGGIPEPLAPISPTRRPAEPTPGSLSAGEGAVALVTAEPTPRGTAAADPPPSPVGPILLAGALGAALGIGGAAAYRRLRRREPAE